MTIVLLLCTTLLMPFLSEAQQKEPSPAKATTAPRNSHRQDPARQCVCQLSEAERLELEKDLEKMRTLIGQMQNNLAAAATGETPLKHQFQLDIEMWQLQLQRMERRLESSDKR